MLKTTGREAGDERRPDFDRCRRDALEAVSDIDESKLFDMVLVDEAQDLDKAGLEWLRIAGLVDLAHRLRRESPGDELVYLGEIVEWDVAVGDQLHNN